MPIADYVDADTGRVLERVEYRAQRTDAQTVNEVRVEGVFCCCACDGSYCTIVGRARCPFCGHPYAVRHG